MKRLIYKTLQSVVIISVVGIIFFTIGFLDTAKDCVIAICSAVIAVFSENMFEYIKAKK